MDAMQASIINCKKVLLQLLYSEYINARTCFDCRGASQLIIEVAMMNDDGNKAACLAAWLPAWLYALSIKPDT